MLYSLVKGINLYKLGYQMAKKGLNLRNLLWAEMTMFQPVGWCNIPQIPDFHGLSAT